MRILIIGSGLAGINAALLAADFADVTLISKSGLSETNTQRAQGGIAAAVAALDDPSTHAADTIRAGAGLCDPAAVHALTSDGPEAIERLQRLGVPFDRGAAGTLSLASEGAHSIPRVLHAGGDQTGVHIQATLEDRLKDAQVDVRTQTGVMEIAVDGGRCVGAITTSGEAILADAVLLATGGAGALYRTTTNPPNATGDGVALALRAGAVVRDMEFVQFHPTALVTEHDAFLVSEALRGDGAILLDAHGDRFMIDVHPDAELAPRSVVARAISDTMRRDGGNCVWLDISHHNADHLRRRFPGVYQGVIDRGFDMTVGPIPIAPAAHYLMGGVYTDAQGRTTVPGLFAAGECASTGAHGANRVASNSLLEAAVFSARAVSAIARHAPPATAPRSAIRNLRLTPNGSAPSLDALRSLMNDRVGIARNARDLTTAVDQLDDWLQQPPNATRADHALATLSARLIAAAALERSESRGGHVRDDYPDLDAAWQRHSLWQLARE